jgi:hypothetical protein
MIANRLVDCDDVISAEGDTILMKRYDSNILRNPKGRRLSRSVPYFNVLFIVLFFPTTTVLGSNHSPISDVQSLLNLANTSLIRGDLDSSIDSLDEALNIIQELKVDEGVADEDDDNLSNDLEGEDEGIIDNNDGVGDSNEIGGTQEGMVDDNVERSQRCVENAKPGEVCALS